MVACAMFFLLLAGNVIGDTSVAMNLKSGMMVLGGTLMSTFLAFSMRTVKDLIKSLRELFREVKIDYEGLIREMKYLARVGRQYGIKALEEEGNKVSNLFLRKGIELVVDGYDRYEIRNILEKEYELYFSRKESQVNVLNTLAKLAPVFGFVGTVVGLINALSSIEDPKGIGKAMALALLTTFYGLIFANFLFLPLAKKLSEHTKAEATLLNVILEGVMDISENKHAASISHRLHSYLSMYHLTSADGSGSSSPVELQILNFPPHKMTARK
jgi:chemotaxis protein MotA